VKTAKAYSPAGISSFFEICDATPDGEPILDLEKVGARGGGFGIKKGVLTEVSVSEAKINEVSVFINEKHAPQAETTRTVVEMLLRKTSETYSITVKHQVEIPIGAGFGSSAGGALTTALALSKALNLNLTFNQLGKIAHIAEVRCKTGLGTVGPLMLGGCVLTLEPGAPGISIIDRIPISENYVIVAGVFGPISTKEVLSSPERRFAVNRWGKKTLEMILAEPSLENFLICCRKFAEKTGFVTERVQRLMKLADDSGTIGAAQNMVGEAVHALTTLENAENVVQAFKQVLSPDEILVATIETQGARFVG
jgi:pantoate kinase